jgi:hypothetical protein
MTTRPDDNDAMRGTTGDDTPRRAQAFDAAARAAHADALQHVSARVQAQLQQRRRAALAGETRTAARPLWQRTGPLLALGGTAALALAIGLRFAGERAGVPNDGVSVNDTPHIAAQSDAAPTDRSPPAIRNTPDTATAMSTNDATHPVSETPQDEAAAARDTSMREIDVLLAEAGGDETDGDDARDNGMTNDAPMLAANDDPLLAGLDENPDLYLWLGSDESQADAVELL